MSKFKNRLFSVILSTVTLAGGVTTCLVSDSAVQYCTAIITDEEMKGIINKALELSFKQDSSLPKITAENLKELLESTLNTLNSAKQMGCSFNPCYWFTLPTLVNTFLLQLSYRLLDHFMQRNSTPPEQLLLLSNFCKVTKQTPRGTDLPIDFTRNLMKLLEAAVPSADSYFPADFFTRWRTACSTGLESDALQKLLQ